MTSGAEQSSAMLVERLTLRVPTMSEADAHRLAQLVARRLRSWPATLPAGSSVDTVQVRVDGGRYGPSDGLSALAERIAHAVLTAEIGGPS